MDSVQLVDVVSGQAENFGKRILLSLTRGAENSEGEKVSLRTYKSSVMQIVSEVQVLVHFFQVCFLKQNTWNFARLGIVLLIQTVLDRLSFCGGLLLLQHCLKH